ncbi:hypothetical protein BC628DRAFT_454706 [Trametes gibbosa]|nr:hypothetical protein BC628DRAFT_454706 [Trametes gibbosa]
MSKATSDPTLTVQSMPNVHPDFASPDVGVVLRSSNGVLFRISAEALCRSSSWFKSMSTLPQDPSMCRTESIPMADAAATLLAVTSKTSSPLGKSATCPWSSPSSAWRSPPA